MSLESSTLTPTEFLRLNRRIEPVMTDYLPDDQGMPYDDRVKFYRLLRDDIGIHAVRTEFRMKRLIRPDRTYDEDTVRSYTDSLRAMKNADLGAPTIVLFTPDKWMKRLAHKNPQEFLSVHEGYVRRVLELCKDAGVMPQQLQVMNEINFSLQTGESLPLIIDMIKRTRAICDEINPGVKIMTTVLASKGNWQEFTKDLIRQTGDALQAVGFDWYPGTYVDLAVQLPNVFSGGRAALASLAEGKGISHAIAVFGKHMNIRSLNISKAFQSFGRVDPYAWIADEKDHGCLVGKDIIFAETGVTALSSDSRFQRLGYDRIIQALDHFLLSLGSKGTDLFSQIIFFTGGHHEGVDTKTPGGYLDFRPWTLVRKDKEGNWQMTNAGKRLKHLIQTRIHPVHG